MDETDKRIIKWLQKDAKTNIKVLAAELKMTKTPIYERIRKLEENGSIDRYVAMVGKPITENSMVVYCSVSLDSQQLEKIKNFSKAVAKIPQVMECYLMGGANDFLLKVVVEDLSSYHRFSSGILAALPNVSQIKSTFVLDEVKHSTVWPIYP